MGREGTVHPPQCSLAVGATVDVAHFFTLSDPTRPIIIIIIIINE